MTDINYTNMPTTEVGRDLGDDGWVDHFEADESSQISVSGSPGHVTVCGELDFDSAARFRAAMDAATSLEHLDLILDMSQVSFMDSSGLRELASMRSAGFNITILNASDCVRTLLRVTRMDEVFAVSQHNAG
ncbi:MAG TPA: STAS domain-containing protein [Microthrixaceae bacterium]|nr:STAS domain-containing protein [Microthrixaceae bacterium]